MFHISHLVLTPARFLTLAMVVAASCSSALAIPVTFEVDVPANTIGDVYIAGDFQGWNPGSTAHRLVPIDSDTWGITLDLPEGSTIEYKYTRGSWATVEKGSAGQEIANRTATISETTVRDEVAQWADGQPSSITGDVRIFFFQSFLNGRTLRVYVPAGYDESSASYPVLYMHDGQNLFDDQTSFAGEWRVDETAELLIGRGEIEPLIIVGIDNSAARISEYTPWPDSSFGGGQADNYLRAIRDQLIPEINTRFRTRAGREHTMISGSSLGGLVSTYAVTAFPETFGRAASLSPSYWWNGQRIVQHIASTDAADLPSRLYHDFGTSEGNISPFRNTQAALLAAGLTPGAELLAIEDPGGQHNEFYWAQRMPDALRFLIDPPCIPDLNGDGIVESGDIQTFVDLFLNQDPAVDLNGDGFVETADISSFVEVFLAGCD